MTPYERALEALAKAESDAARLKTPDAIRLVLRARKFASQVFEASFGTEKDPSSTDHWEPSTMTACGDPAHATWPAAELAGSSPPTISG